jgi:hypothetical protein
MVPSPIGDSPPVRSVRDCVVIHVNRRAALLGGNCQTRKQITSECNDGG